MTVLCTNNTAWIGNPGYLYLPTGWYETTWYASGRCTILAIPSEPYQSRLYVLSHGPIWVVPKRKEYWRLDLRPDYIRDWMISLNVSTRLWMVNTPINKLIWAERVDYETLRLEAVFE